MYKDRRAGRVALAMGLILGLTTVACEPQQQQSGQIFEPTVETSIGPWPPELRAQATAQAIEKFQTEIPPDQIDDYELVLLSTALPLTVNNISIAADNGVYLMVDAAGNVLGIAAYAGAVSLAVPGIVLSNAVQNTIDTPPEGYTQEDMMRMSREGWKNIIFHNVSTTSESLVDTNGKVIANINVPQNYIYNSDQGGQTIDPTPNGFNELNLPEEYKKIDDLFKSSQIRSELFDTLFKASKARGAEREEALSDPPKFENVNFKVAIYDPKSGKVFEGNWSDFHSWVARANGIETNSYSGKMPKYFSSGVIRIEGTNQAIIKIDTTNGLSFTQQDLINLNNDGYKVIDNSWNWVIQSPSTSQGFVEVPSSLLP